MQKRTRALTSLHRSLLVALLAFWIPGVQSQAPSGPGNTSVQALTPERESALARIRPQSLRGHLSFLASDALMGRDTPSAGLDIAAEYVAAQFRRAGLEEAGDQEFFQTSEWTQVTPDTAGFRLTVKTPDSVLEVPWNRVSASSLRPWEFEDIVLVKSSPEELSSLGALEGKGLILMPEEPGQGPGAGVSDARRRRDMLTGLSRLKPAIALLLDRHVGREGSFRYATALRHPELSSPARPAPEFPLMTVHDARLVDFFDAVPPGLTATSVSLHIPPPREKKVVLRNVVGVLPGSDPALKESYVLLTAHYDHVGVRPWSEGDNIWNGANDNGSGTVSLIEIASALGQLRERNRRSIVFLALFGEERGLLGARYYGRHPVFPLERTVAALNLEQLGRVDSPEGDQTGRASLTGQDYSDLGSLLEAAGRATGIQVARHPQNSDVYFSRSDNQAFADLGIPSHTLCVSFDYPDYHRPSDHWERIDYENMARTNRMIALALLMIADNESAPRWNATNPRTARYRKAWEELQGRAGRRD